MSGVRELSKGIITEGPKTEAFGPWVRIREHLAYVGDRWRGGPWLLMNPLSFLSLAAASRASHVLSAVPGRECAIGILCLRAYIPTGSSLACEWYPGLCLLKNVGEGNGCSDGVRCQLETCNGRVLGMVAVWIKGMNTHPQLREGDKE